MNVRYYIWIIAWLFLIGLSLTVPTQAQTCTPFRSYNECCGAQTSRRVTEYRWSNSNQVCNYAIGTCTDFNATCAPPTPVQLPACVQNRVYDECCGDGVSRRVAEYRWSDGSGVCNYDIGTCTVANSSCAAQPTPAAGSCVYNRTYSECCADQTSRTVDEYRWADGSGVCNYNIGACNNPNSSCTPAPPEDPGEAECNPFRTYNECCGEGISRPVQEFRWSNSNQVCNYSIGLCDQPNEEECGPPAPTFAPPPPDVGRIQIRFMNEDCVTPYDGEGNIGMLAGTSRDNDGNGWTPGTGPIWFYPTYTSRCECDTGWEYGGICRGNTNCYADIIDYRYCGPGTIEPCEKHNMGECEERKGADHPWKPWPDAGIQLTPGLPAVTYTVPPVEIQPINGYGGVFAGCGFNGEYCSGGAHGRVDDPNRCYNTETTRTFIAQSGTVEWTDEISTSVESPTDIADAHSKQYSIGIAAPEGYQLKVRKVCATDNRTPTTQGGETTYHPYFCNWPVYNSGQPEEDDTEYLIVKEFEDQILGRDNYYVHDFQNATGNELVIAYDVCVREGESCNPKEFQFNECVDCNQSRPRYKNTCTDEWLPNESLRFDPACGGPEWCPQDCKLEFVYNQCVDCSTSQSVFQNSCTKEFVQGSHQNDPACTAWCPQIY